MPLGTNAVTPSCAVAPTNSGYGGGGSAGRIQIDSAEGNATIHAQGVVSPSKTSGAAVVGKIDLH